uniref:Mce/MlaD domain-containing protein n=1 Tax=Bornetia secundiflora TaxID=2575637 RepID=A0A4D6WTC8_9FLOR|nr:hypothetical protein [Bornetia secundiflora]
MRGVNVGYIQNIQLDINSIIVLIYIKSQNILIPKYCLIEINQIGLFNNTVIDIIPFQKLNYPQIEKIDLFANQCFRSQFLCNNDYLKGYRGLNYDDLIRAATRISQRFDDPRFFNLFYMCLQNFIDISDEIVFVFNHLTNTVLWIVDYIEHILIKYML